MYSDYIAGRVVKYPKTFLTIVLGFALLLVVLLIYMVPPQKDVGNKEITRALQSVEQGDIVRFQDGNFMMVEHCCGNGLIHFVIPGRSIGPVQMDIKTAAAQAKEVIKYYPTNVVWNHAAFVLMTGRNPSQNGTPIEKGLQ